MPRRKPAPAPVSEPVPLSEGDIKHLSTTLVEALPKHFPTADQLISRLDCDVRAEFSFDSSKIYPDKNVGGILETLKMKREEVARSILECLKNSIDLGEITFIGLERNANWEDLKIDFHPSYVIRDRIHYYLGLTIRAEGDRGRVHKGGSRWRQDQKA